MATDTIVNDAITAIGVCRRIEGRLRAGRIPYGRSTSICLAGDERAAIDTASDALPLQDCDIRRHTTWLLVFGIILARR